MTEVLPLFPLHAVLLPDTRLPLHIFEPRYRQLTMDLITGAVPGKRFGVIALRPDARTEVTEPTQLAGVGCSAVLREAHRLEDGRFDIVTEGERRFRLLDLDHTRAPYLVGTVAWLPDADAPKGAGNAEHVLTRSARAAHRRYCHTAWRRADWSEPPESTELGRLAHLLAVDGLLTMDDRQRLLEETRPLHRLGMVGRMLNREAGILAALHAVPAPPQGLRQQISPN